VKFAAPWWLGAGILAVALIIWLWRRYDARQQAGLDKFISAHLRSQLTRSISVARRRARRGLFLASVAGLFIALAGPLIGFRWEEISRRGNEIIFAIDTSRSMSAPDIKPNRLTRAKLAIDDFAKQLDGDAVGIVAFAGSAFLACPITLDYGAFHESLSAIDTKTIPRGGTNISTAIQAAETALRRRPGSDKILILLTDGEDLEGNAEDAARAAFAADGLKIYTVGVGTAAGDLIPVPQEQGGGFVKDDAGAFVKSRLDETALKAIAAATGGFYVPLGTQGEGLQTIFTTVLGSIAKHDLASRRQKIYTERYQWPLAASLVLLLASLLVGTRRRQRAQVSAASSAAVLCGLIIVAAAHFKPAQAADTKAESAPGPNGSAAPGGALAIDSKRPLLEYNAGTTAYRAGQFPQAAQSFQQSISHAPSSDAQRLAVQQDAYYNLGNALYRAGQKTEKSSVPETLQKWNDAVKAYDTALQLRANDTDSKFNRDLVKRKIDALKQQDPKNQKDQNKNQDKNQNKDQPQNQNQQGQGQGQGQGSGQGQPPQGQPPQGQPPQGQPPQSQPPQGQPPQGRPPQSQPPQGQPPQGQPPQSQPPQGQPPQGQPPQGQPPGGSPDAKNPGPQQDSGQPPEQPPPQSNGQGSNGGQSPKAAEANSDDAQAADNQRIPGEMTREEARELLDSVKGDERHSLGAPVAQRSASQAPDKPYKNW
jgi:Ca-activated chloride channel homolog